MSTINEIDKKNIPAIEALEEVFKATYGTWLKQPLMIDPNHFCVGLLAQKYDVVNLIKYAALNSETISLYRLIDAYIYGGTRYSILQAGYVLYGDGSTIIVDENPGRISIEIRNANSKLDYIVLTEGDYALLADGGYTIITTDLGVASYNPISFFKDFVLPQVVVEAVNVAPINANHTISYTFNREKNSYEQKIIEKK